MPIALAYLDSENRAALRATFWIVLIWALVPPTDVAKAFLGTAAFRAHVAGMLLGVTS